MLLAFEANTVSVCTKSLHLVHATVTGSSERVTNFVLASPSCRSSYTFIPFLISYHSTGWSVVEESHRKPANSYSGSSLTTVLVDSASGANTACKKGGVRNLFLQHTEHFQVVKCRSHICVRTGFESPASCTTNVLPRVHKLLVPTRAVGHGNSILNRFVRFRTESGRKGHQCKAARGG
jgi:hypothetical protein